MEQQVMAITVDATYEDGVLKLRHPLPFKEHEQVRVSVEPSQGWAQRTYGILGWQGDAETVQRIALDSEFGVEESP
jgi:predicted DNA-binding antitoxin AbrB/MazE fold protein